jgi:hypothetical protein
VEKADAFFLSEQQNGCMKFSLSLQFHCKLSHRGGTCRIYLQHLCSINSQSTRTILMMSPLCFASFALLHLMTMVASSWEILSFAKELGFW